MPRKILIVDDEPDVAQVAQKRLIGFGFAVTVLNVSKDAVAVIKKERPDLILLDIMMPQKDGYQICDEVRSDDEIKHIPIIVFTAQPVEKELIGKAHGFYGADDYLLKPFTAEELLGKIKKYLKDGK